jgi:hypothetical protein
MLEGIQTKMQFGDCLHIEWNAPDVVDIDGGQWRNSGVFFSK